MDKRRKPNCPKCGGEYQKISGFYRCEKCNYVSGSQKVVDLDAELYGVYQSSVEDEENIEMPVHLVRRRYDHGLS